MRNIFLTLLLALTIKSALICNTAVYEKQKDGVIVRLQNQNENFPKLLKIQICTDEIIRIIASPVDSFSTRKSLMVNKMDWPEVDWSIIDNKDVLEILTSRLTIKVNVSTGIISFYDKNGSLLLEENQVKNKIITPAIVMDENTFHIQQIFNSPEDEAFYGLGAHQNGDFNYKGKDVDLYQYNIVDINPFLVSSKNYGILWDNNSRTKFGDIREYEPISTLKLYTKDGEQNGLTAEYFADENFTKLYTSRTENRIEHEYLDVNDSYPEGFAENVKAIRWTGSIESNETGLHKLKLYCSAYTKMWIDNKLVVDSWRQNWLPWNHKIEIDMKSGEKHQIKIEWIHNTGYIGLRYLTPEIDKIENTISLYSDVADQIDYYFVKGNNIDEVIKGYRTITGKAPMMPKWALGLWQCRERYKSQAEILDVVKEFRKRKIPFDNIVQDWFYWKEDQWGEHEFEASRYPDPVGMVEELHDKLNTHIMITVWTKFYVGTKHYNEFLNNGWLYMRNIEKQQRDWVGPGYFSTFYDTYSEGARKLYWKQIDKKLFSKGFDAWWLDSTEPDLQSNLSFNEWLLRIGPTALGTSARYLNTYSLMNCKGVYEGQRESDPNKRVFILTRSSFAGQQRYSVATWSGDVAARWFDLKQQIPAGLNFALAGIPYWTTDIGGFAVEPRYENLTDADVDEWRELNTRWFQFGTFCPVFRVHGQFPYREMFNIAPEDHPAYKTMLAYDKLRYRLMPYIYSLTGMVTQNDYTIIRALIMDFGYDNKVTSIGDQFMFGPSLMINPVTNFKERSRKVYLPENYNWYNLKTGEYILGGQTILAEAPYEDIPIYIKAGSIIPIGPEIEYASQKSNEPMKIFIFSGNDAAFTLYEDEDVNYNYEKGRFSTIIFNYNEESKALNIENRIGEFDGMQKDKIFEIIFISKDKISGLDFSRQPDKVVKYDGSKVSISFK